jgi:hypothetical protein
MDKWNSMISKMSLLFFLNIKTENRKAEQVLSGGGGWYQWEGGGCEERM